jgi:hypothetical protein
MFRSSTRAIAVAVIATGVMVSAVQAANDARYPDWKGAWTRWFPRDPRLNLRPKAHSSFLRFIAKTYNGNGFQTLASRLGGKKIRHGFTPWSRCTDDKFGIASLTVRAAGRYAVHIAAVSGPEEQVPIL